MGGLRKRRTRRVSRRRSFRKSVRKSGRKPPAVRRSKGGRKVPRKAHRNRRVKRRMVGGMDLQLKSDVWVKELQGARAAEKEFRKEVLETEAEEEFQQKEDMRAAAEAEEETRLEREAEGGQQRAASSGEFPAVTTTNPGLRWMVEYELRKTPYKDENTLSYPKLRRLGAGTEIRTWICRFEDHKLIVRKLGMGNHEITYDIGAMDAQEDYEPPQIHVGYIAGEEEECFREECRLILKFKNKAQLRKFMAGFA